MSLAENLLNSLDETAYQNMRIAGGVPEEHIKVGQDRVITVPNSLKTIAVKGDKDIETVTFDCVRYWDGHDLSTFAIYINYILPNGDEGTYIPESITRYEDVFSFDWEIGSEITYVPGKLTFWIVTKLTDDSGVLIKQWSSFQNSDCTIAQGGDKIYVPEKQTDQDVISQAISISRASAEHAEQQANLAIEAANKAALDASHAAEEEVSRIIGELGVVQELGNSPNSVVSQAKVTKEFFNANAKIDRNFKAIENIKAGIPAEQFETDDSVAYVKDVPEGALPYAEVKKVGGMTYKDGDTLRSAKVTEVESVGENLINIEDAVAYRGSISVENDAIKWTCSEDMNHNFAFSVWVDVKPNTHYHIEWNYTNAIDRVFIYSDKLYGTKLMTSSVRPGGVFDTKEHKRILIGFYVETGAASGDTDTVSNIMLNEGAIGRPYTPYVEHTLPIPEAVQALDGYGLGVSDTVYNYIDWEKKQFVKRCAGVDLGTLDWAPHGSVASLFEATLPKESSTYDGSMLANAICSDYNTNIWHTVEEANKRIALLDYRVRAYNTAYTDAATFKAAMSGEMLVYELATHVVTDISSLITEDNFIGVEGNGTLTFKNAYEYSVPSEVEYQLEV